MFEEVSKILVVDDETVNLELISAIFIDSPNIMILTASDGLEAMEVLKNHTPDVIVLDIRMPRMDGIEVLDALKSDQSTSHIPVVVLSGDEKERKNALKHGANDFIPKPFDAEELKLRVLNNLQVKKYQDLIKNINEVLQKEVMKKTKELREALELAREAEYEMVVKLGMLSEFRDEETGQHIRRISHYSKLLAQLAGLSEFEQNILFYASPLHDVGKVGIPDSILKKPGPLTSEEFELMKLHTVIGGKILTSDPRFITLHAGKIIAEQHHEKWDGSGYPKGLKEREIHIYARIVAVCDVFDAMTSDRVYRPAFTVEQTLEIMKKGKGSHFDPQLIEIFFNNIDEFIKIRETFRD
ncbi:putative two-component system response regulator [Thermodesulfovibrio aggregans]|uniref:Putative two-component system response regulator n=1 Tax=Thermodesulfovibrio aggregans TaxID=86166 RepID=A0A0U9HSA5_9BACT|nr:HD domain-containing phosphohydrolase [Thermodesulfovibrio aggregans]GAQ95716.1 putative two-component system response regulator [Thermodesulfovibrio aggregans]